MRVFHTIALDTHESDTLHKAITHIRIGFPTDGIDMADKDQARNWPGRQLNGMDKGGIYRPDQVYDALDQIMVLAETIREQTSVDYWHQELHPLATHEEALKGGGLVAPGTDLCSMLAEIRKGQLRDVLEAIPVLEEACRQVGEPEEWTGKPGKYEEV